MAQEKKRAQILRGTLFIYVVAMSGRHGSRPDRQAFQQFFSRDVCSRELGAAVQNALGASRQIEDDTELKAFFEANSMLADTQSWNEEATRRYDYPSIEAMYASMQNVGVTKTPGGIVFDPSRQDIGGWTRKGIPSEDSCVVAVEASDEEIGCAAIAALENCR